MVEENNSGTVAVSMRFFRLGLFINFVFSLLGIIPYLVFGFQGLLSEMSNGLWPILMCNIVIQCY
jgi:hypothetical protein